MEVLRGIRLYFHKLVSGLAGPAAAQAQLGLGNLDEALTLITTFDELAPECGEYSQNMRMNGWVRRFNAGIDMYNSNDLQGALENFVGANAFRQDLRSVNNAALIYQEIVGDPPKAQRIEPRLAHARTVPTDR